MRRPLLQRPFETDLCLALPHLAREALEVIVNQDALAAHRRAIEESEDGWFTWGGFEALYADLVVSGYDKGLRRISRQFTAIVNRQQQLRTIVLKLDWMKGKRDSDELGADDWMFFAASDVISFVTTVRSLFDHLARSFAEVATHRASVPKFSFNDLQRWLERDRSNSEILGEDLAELILADNWFEAIKAMRDDLIHQDARALVFPDTTPITFVVHGGTGALSSDPLLMYNENVANFERFAAAVLARLHVLLEASASAVRDRAAVGHGVGDGRSLHRGLAVLADWLDECIEAYSQT